MDPAVSAFATCCALELVACSGGRPARGSDGAGLANLYWLHFSPFRRRVLRRRGLRTSTRPPQPARRPPAPPAAARGARGGGGGGGEPHQMCAHREHPPSNEHADRRRTPLVST